MNILSDLYSILDRYAVSKFVSFGSKSLRESCSKPWCCDEISDQFSLLASHEGKYLNNFPQFVLNLPDVVSYGGTNVLHIPSLQQIIASPYFDHLHNTSESWPISFHRAITNYSRAAERMIPPIVTGTSLLLKSTWSTNYYHFLTEILGKLYVFSRYFDIESMDKVVFDSKLESVPFFEYWLMKLGISPKKILFLDDNICARFENLIVPSYSQSCGHISRELVDFIRTKSSEKINYKTNTVSTGANIYISRAKTSRTVVNESEIIPILLNNNFEILYLEELEVEKQIEKFSTAKLIVAPHGAGLTNLLFTGKSQVKILELFGEDYINNCFARIANTLDHQHFYHVSGDAVNGNFSVSGHVIDQFLTTH